MSDEDKPGWRTRVKRRQQDIDFLAWLKTAMKQEILAMMKLILPEWREIALKRALKRELMK